MTVVEHTTPVPVEIRLWRLLATLIAAVLFGVGWTAGKLVTATMWSVTAIRLGWDDARGRAG